MKTAFILSRYANLTRVLIISALLLTESAFAPVVFAQRGDRVAPAAPEGLTLAETSIGLRLKYSSTRDGTAIVIDKITSGSRAAQLDLKRGDILTHLNDQPVASLDRALLIIEDWAGRQPGRLSLQLSRGKAKIKVFLYPPNYSGRPAPAVAVNERRSAPGRPAVTETTDQVQNAKRDAVRARRFAATQEPVRLAHTDVSDPWQIPGFTTAPRPKNGINVLRRIFIDPQTGTVAFAGYYDPNYATGPIDYSTLLHDALRSPAPSFSLEPTAASKAASAAFMRDFDQQMQRNLGSLAAGKTWLIGIFNALISDPALETDRRRFVARGVELLGVPAEDIPACVRGMLGQVPEGSPDWARFWSQCYGQLGSRGGATFVRAGASNDAAGLSNAIDQLRIRPAIDELRQLKQSGSINDAQAQARAEVAIWGAILEDCRVDDPRWKSAAERASRTGDLAPFRALIDDINANLVRERIIEPWLNGLVLSESFLQVMHRMPPLEVAPVCLEGLSADSELARTFLAADWTLKTLGTTPELATRVPGHVTPSQFAFRLESERQVYDLGDVSVRFWLVPESVTLRHDPSGTILTCDDSRPAVRAKIMSHQRSGSSAARQLATEAMSGYAAMLTQRYEDYALALPELHQLREAAKVLALVRWAKARNYTLVPPAPPAPSRPLPTAFARGFWTGNFDSAGGRTFFGLVAIGGVDFGEDAGTAWVQPSVDPALKTTALGQLVGSAALGQQATDAALRGDLDSARALSDQSARAMTGDFDFTGNPALPGIPPASPPSPVDQAILQNELALQSRQSIDALAQAKAELQQAGADANLQALANTKKNQAEERLSQIRDLLGQGAQPVEATRQVVKLLRNGDWGLIPKPRTVAANAPVATPPTTTDATPASAIDPEERARIRNEITQLRTELCRIQQQLRRLNASIQSDQDQRAEWEKVTDEAYNSALDRAKEKLQELSVDFPTDILEDKLSKVTDPAERAKIQQTLRFLKRLKDTYAFKDFASWADQEKMSRAEVMAGIKQLADLCEVEDRIKDYLEKKWGLKKFFAFRDAAQDLITSTYDVTAEVLAWRRLKQLNQNSDDFLKATEASGRRIRELIGAIHEREVRLGLDPGSTKEPCATP